jgi:hypothetical protein
MAKEPKDVSLFQGGTADHGTFVHCLGQPQYFGPPFGMPRHKNNPLGNSHYDAASPRADFTASEALYPAVFEKQRNAFHDSLVGGAADVGRTIQLVIVPVNHYLMGVRFDVAEPDPNMAGATVAITGQLVTESLTEPYDEFDIAEDPEFAAAATAQGLADIPIAVPSSNTLWLAKVGGSAVSGSANLTTGDVTGTAGGSYLTPYYVAPQVRVDSDGHTHLLERGALLLGLKIKSLPTDAKYKIWDMANPMFLSAIITAFNFKSNT